MYRFPRESEVSLEEKTALRSTRAAHQRGTALRRNEKRRTIAQARRVGAQAKSTRTPGFSTRPGGFARQAIDYIKESLITKRLLDFNEIPRGASIEEGAPKPVQNNDTKGRSSTA